MESTEVVRGETESTADVRALLQGSVFHVTRRTNWQAIEASGKLLPNPGGNLRTTFGFSRNSFFRNRGCVSLFDYRAPATEEITDFRFRCDPLQPAEPGGEGIAILVLNPSICGRLISWTKWKEEEAYAEMVVPHVEAGHPGPISLEEVQRLIFFRRTEDSHSVAAAFRRSYAHPGQG